MVINTLKATPTTIIPNLTTLSLMILLYIILCELQGVQINLKEKD